MRNLGGAIGLALIDSIIYGRAPHHAQAIVDRLMAGDTATAKFVGIPLALFVDRPPGPLDSFTKAILKPMVERAAYTEAVNDAWAVVAILTLTALISVPFARPKRTT